MKKTNLRSPGKPAYLQIMENIRAQIASGDLKPDDRLPAIRALAATLKIDPGTVARAYLELIRDGSIIARHGSGNYVAPLISNKALLAKRRQKLEEVMEKSFIEALGLGFSIEDIETVATLQLAEWRERRAPPAQRKKAARKTPQITIRFSGSHDLAVELLVRHIGTLEPDIALETKFIGSLAGLVAVERGEAEIAGAHLVDEASGEFNLPFIRKMMPNETVIVINLMHRIQGLMVNSGNPKGITGIKDLVRKDILFVNRQKGSGTRILLDSRLRTAGISPVSIRGYAREETTHMAVAGLIARQKADIGMGVQSAADVSGLDFIPLFKERYDLVFLRQSLEKAGISMIPDIIGSENFKKMLRAIPGYDTSDTGKLTVITP